MVHGASGKEADAAGTCGQGFSLRGAPWAPPGHPSGALQSGNRKVCTAGKPEAGKNTQWSWDKSASLAVCKTPGGPEDSQRKCPAPGLRAAEGYEFSVPPPTPHPLPAQRLQGSLGHGGEAVWRWGGGRGEAAGTKWKLKSSL